MTMLPQAFCETCEGDGTHTLEVDELGTEVMVRCLCTRETQETIEDWRVATFGSAPSIMRMATRANKEMGELLHALSADDRKGAAEEVADVVILLYGVAQKLGIDLHDAVDRKMDVNRKREWKLDGTGHGYHVRDKDKEEPMPQSG